MRPAFRSAVSSGQLVIPTLTDAVTEQYLIIRTRLSRWVSVSGHRDIC